MKKKQVQKPANSSSEGFSKNLPKPDSDIVAKAKGRFLAISPRKAILVAKAIKKLPLEKAQKTLEYSSQKAAKLILGVLNSAISNAKQKDIEGSSLEIKNIFVNQAPSLRKIIYKHRGRADWAKKRRSHIIVDLKNIKSQIRRKHGAKS